MDDEVTRIGVIRAVGRQLSKNSPPRLFLEPLALLSVALLLKAPKDGSF